VNASRHAADPPAVAQGASIIVSAMAASFSAAPANASWKAAETSRALS